MTGPLFKFGQFCNQSGRLDNNFSYNLRHKQRGSRADVFIWLYPSHIYDAIVASLPLSVFLMIASPSIGVVSVEPFGRRL